METWNIQHVRYKYPLVRFSWHIYTTLSHQPVLRFSIVSHYVLEISPLMFGPYSHHLIFRMYFGRVVLTVVAIFTGITIAYQPDHCWIEDGERTCIYIPPP